MNVGDQAYCPLSDNEIISAARKFRILVKSLSSPVKKKVHTYICSYANKLVLCVCYNSTFLITVLLLLLLLLLLLCMFVFTVAADQCDDNMLLEQLTAAAEQ